MLTPHQVIDTYFLEARHMLLEIAAVARAGGPVGNGRPAADAAKLAALRESLRILAEPAPGRERTVELLELFAQA